MPSSLEGAIVPESKQHSIQKERTMERILTSDAELREHATDEGVRIHAWRAEQLRRLGLPRILAEAFAETIDWHEVADLMSRGCPLGLALEIAR
jgi:hypothetical protein